jgi:hypothetical protein
MPWALGGADGIATFAQVGPGARWEPSEACVRDIDEWLAATSADDSWAAGTGSAASAPVCDAPGGGGVDDPAWVAVVTSRAAAAAAQLELVDELPTGSEWDAEQARYASVGADEATTTTVAGDPAADLDARRRAANLRGLTDQLTGGGALLPLSRVTVDGTAPADMPPVLDPNADTAAASGTKAYSDIVTELAYELGGLVAGEGAAYRDEDENPLALLSEFRLNAPGGYGGAGMIGGEIPFAALFNEVAPKYGLDPRFLAAVAWAESSFNDDVIYCRRTSSAGARGLMQFMPATAAGFGIDPCDPPQAVDGAARYYQGLYKQYGRWDLALAAYNAGSGNVRKYGGVPPFTETRNYIAKIMNKWEEYKAKYPDQLPVGPIGGGFGGTVTVPGGRMVNTATRGQVCVVPIPSSPGTIVNCNIAGNVEAMYQHAARDGIVLKGGAHRPVEIQIQLREQRCPGRVYDRSCKGSPPTAVPGRSMHETGEAIDVTYNGSIIGSRSSPAFVWLAANAGRYGLINLPSEPWHWSTNGN